MNEENLQSEDLKEVIAANLVHLRQEAGLTQLQLAQMLNYSDKAVSKWERGESIPDLRVLIKLADIYNISLDTLVRSKPGKRLKPRLNLKKKHALITLLSIGLVGVIATAIFMIFYYIIPFQNYAYLAYVCAPFVASIVFTVFSSLWYGRVTMTIAASLVLWSIVLIINVFLVLFAPLVPVWPFYLAAGIMQVLIIGWFILRKLYKPDRNNRR
ncbi:MAG: helix-turn-helix domain-containing protein [Candidatus Coproplasma sp.]